MNAIDNLKADGTQAGDALYSVFSGMSDPSDVFDISEHIIGLMLLVMQDALDEIGDRMVAKGEKDESATEGN